MNVPLTAYSVAASSFHWLTAVPMIGCVATVLKSQQVPKEEKGIWMHRHKSLGLLSGIIVAPRIAYRLLGSKAYRVEEIAGTNTAEQLVASATHYMLYGFMLVMPATGVAMGYYGGKGLPFFATTLPGIQSTPETKASNGAIAKRSFKIHKTLGTYGKYLVPAHFAGALQHYFRGHVIFSRVNPFRGPPKH